MRTLSSRTASRAAEATGRAAAGTAGAIFLSRLAFCGCLPVNPAGTRPAGVLVRRLLRDRLHQSLDHLVDTEARRPLAWRIVLEGLQEGRHPPHAVLKQVGVLGQPVVILIRDNVRALHRIHT